MTDAETTNVRIVKGTYAAFSRGNIEAAVGAMHPDIVWHEAEHSLWHAPQGHRGPTEVVSNVFARIPADFDDFDVVTDRVHDAGATVIVEGRYRGTATSAAPLDAQFCHVWTVRDGKLAGFQQYTDTWQFVRVATPSNE